MGPNRQVIDVVVRIFSLNFKDIDGALPFQGNLECTDKYFIMLLSVQNVL